MFGSLNTINFLVRQPESLRRSLVQASPLLYDSALHQMITAGLPPRAGAALLDLLAALRAWE